MRSRRRRLAPRRRARAPVSGPSSAGASSEPGQPERVGIALRDRRGGVRGWPCGPPPRWSGRSVSAAVAAGARRRVRRAAPPAPPAAAPAGAVGRRARAAPDRCARSASGSVAPAAPPRVGEREQRKRAARAPVVVGAGGRQRVRLGEHAAALVGAARQPRHAFGRRQTSRSRRDAAGRRPERASPPPGNAPPPPWAVRCGCADVALDERRRRQHAAPACARTPGRARVRARGARPANRRPARTCSRR